MVVLKMVIRDYVYTKDVALPAVPRICDEGDVKKVTCPDGTVITSHRCVNNLWVDTGERCPPVCPEFALPYCPDGVLVEQPVDPVTGCPRPPVCKPFGFGKVVKILTSNERLPDAHDGETVKITAQVYCKKNSEVTKPRELAYLVIDGALVDQKSTSDGEVSFDWVASAVPVYLHNVCVRVLSSDACKAFGQDCRRIFVSPVVMLPAEQLAREREAVREQRRLLEEARRALREEIVAYPAVPTVAVPAVPTVPTVPIVPVVPPVTPVLPDVGSIEIISIPSLVGGIIPAVPVYIYLDDKNIGRIYETPKVISDVSVGSHSVYVRAGDFVSPARTVYVTKDTKTTVVI